MLKGDKEIYAHIYQAIMLQLFFSVEKKELGEKFRLKIINVFQLQQIQRNLFSDEK